jgi:hypothetical protein
VLLCIFTLRKPFLKAGKAVLRLLEENGKFQGTIEFLENFSMA